MKRLVIFGLGTFAKTAKLYFSDDSPYQVAAFTADQEYMNGERFMDLPVEPFESLPATFPPSEYALFVAVGFKRLNKNRSAACQRAKALGYELATYVSSKAQCWTGVPLGENCFVLENNVIQPFVQIGNDVVLWSGNHIGHDAVIEDHCFITSHVVLSGHVRVGSYSFVGVNACARHGVQIGRECIIGAGAVILKDTPPRSAHLVKSTPGITLPISELEKML